MLRRKSRTATQQGDRDNFPVAGKDCQDAVLSPEESPPRRVNERTRSVERTSTRRGRAPKRQTRPVASTAGSSNRQRTLRRKTPWKVGTLERKIEDVERRNV